MALLQDRIVALISRFAANLRFPVLFFLTAGLFLLDLAIPDLIPFSDELLLGLGTLLLGSLRRRKAAAADPQAAPNARRRP